MKHVGSFKTDDFFTIRFCEKYEEWQLNQKKNGFKGSQAEFARLVLDAEKEIHPDNPLTKCDYRYVSKWLNGRMKPEKYLEAIARVLGVEPDYFKPKERNEQYRYSPEYMNSLIESEILPYCEETGIDPEFIRFIRGLVDFDELFPLWRPMQRIANPFVDYTYYLADESVLADSAPMKDNTFQVHRSVTVKDGEKEERLITLGRPDLLFLKDVQKSVKKYIEFLFMQRAKEMKEEVEEANRRVRIPVKGGGIGVRLMKWSEMKEIAPYYRAFKDPDED